MVAQRCGESGVRVLAWPGCHCYWRKALRSRLGMVQPALRSTRQRDPAAALQDRSRPRQCGLFAAVGRRSFEIEDADTRRTQCQLQRSLLHGQIDIGLAMDMRIVMAHVVGVRRMGSKQQ
ncbi:hypothetical protein D3C73_1153940 [compost metagenome]